MIEWDILGVFLELNFFPIIVDYPLNQAVLK